MMNTDLREAVKAGDPVIASGTNLAWMPAEYSSDLFSIGELRQISAEISRDYAPVYLKKKPVSYNRIKLTASELLEISIWVSRFYSPTRIQAKDLLLLPIDPGHVYVYWHLPDSKPIKDDKDNLGQELALKVYPLIADQPTVDDDATPMMEFTLDGKVSHRQILALPGNQGDAGYVAVIGVVRPGKPFKPLTQATVISVKSHRPSVPPVQSKSPFLTSLQHSPAASSSYRQFSASGQR